MKKIILFFLLFISIQTTYAAEFEALNLPTQAINPGDFYYSVIRLWEKSIERLQFGDGKFDYLISLVDKRMAELGFIVKNRRLDEVQRSSERLAYYAGILTDYTIKQNNQDKMNKLKVRMNSFQSALAELRDYFPANSSFWMLVQHDINSLKEYSEKLSI